MKPLIGVTPLFDIKKDSLWMLPDYMDSITLAGGLPVMLPLTDDPELLAQCADEVDGVLFTGGHDVHPSMYGQKKSIVCGETCGMRDRMETELFRLIREKDKPLFGICRGLQLINVLFGGTLYQDLTRQYRSSDIGHRMEPPYDRTVHAVTTAEDSLLRRLAGEEIQVNSSHHQAVMELGEGLRATGWATDGLVEAIEIPEARFALAVQWHPERLAAARPEALALFEAFVNACKA